MTPAERDEVLRRVRALMDAQRLRYTRPTYEANSRARVRDEAGRALSDYLDELVEGEG